MTDNLKVLDGGLPTKVEQRQRTHGIWPSLAAYPFAEKAVLRIGAAVLIFGSWELAVRTGFAQAFWVSSPSAILLKLYDWFFVKKDIYLHLGITLSEVFLGLAAGSVFGVACGLALSRWRRLNIALDPFLVGFYSMPRAALAPLFILWFGIGIGSKVIFAGFVTFFIMLMNTYNGVKTVDIDLLNAVRTMGGNDLTLYRRVILHSCVPWILVGLKVGLAFSLTGAVFAEMLAAEAGIGMLIAFAAGVFDTTTVLGGVLILVIVAMVLNELLRLVESRLLAWREDVIT